MCPTAPRRTKRNKGKEPERTKDEWRALFWNIAGLTKKDRDFWKYIEEFDFVEFTETWVEERTWKNIKAILPVNYNWKCNMHWGKIEKDEPAGG